MVKGRHTMTTNVIFLKATINTNLAEFSELEKLLHVDLETANNTAGITVIHDPCINSDEHFTSCLRSSLGKRLAV